MQAIKACADQLVALGKKMEHEDIIDRVLLGLDESYNSVIESVNGRDTPISYEELHEKLINKEFSLHQARPEPDLPASVFAATTKPQKRTYGRSSGSGSLPTPTATANTQSKFQPRPFLGKCQWCREQGHVVSQCPVFT